MRTWQEYKAILKEHIKVWGLEWKLLNDTDANLITIADRGGSIEVYINQDAIPAGEEE
tara:strand:- start:6205 stop:6378 length:174 start_codon:yes stop_codon:yes gene_type:complete